VAEICTRDPELESLPRRIARWFSQVIFARNNHTAVGWPKRLQIPMSICFPRDSPAELPREMSSDVESLTTQRWSADRDRRPGTVDQIWNKLNPRFFRMLVHRQ
jgi:hypothetical protein